VSNRPSSKYANGFPSDTASGRPPVQASTSGHQTGTDKNRQWSLHHFPTYLVTTDSLNPRLDNMVPLELIKVISFV